MDANQQEAILRAIAVSYLPSYHHNNSNSSQDDRRAAFAILEDFKRYDGRIPAVLAWLCADQLSFQGQDITVPTKLLSLEILSTFIRKQQPPPPQQQQQQQQSMGGRSGSGGGYSTLSESDRLSLRRAVLQAGRVVAVHGMTLLDTKHNDGSSSSQQQQQQQQRILAKKLAAILEGLVIRDFPQRWTTFVTDVFAPLQHMHNNNSNNPLDGVGTGGLWYDDACDRSVIHLGVNILLECFKLVAEDCTDSDYNSKISTQRRNDVLIGLNEVSEQFLPHIYRLLEQAYPKLQQSKQTLYNMHQYLNSNGRRTTANMTLEERTMYQKEVQQRQSMALVLADALVMLEKFASSCPLAWLLGAGGGSSSSPSASSLAPPSPPREFVTAILFLFREREAQVQLRAIECIEMLCSRGKLEVHQWMRLIRELPGAVQQANAAFAAEQEQRRVERAATTGESSLSSDDDPLALQLDFHRSLARMLAGVVASHLSHLTTSKHVITAAGKKGRDYESIQTFLRLLVEILHHPSGRMCTEQVGMWTSLCRDPQIVKTTQILDPFLEEVMGCYMDQMVRVRWEDVENQTHPQYRVLEASFDDEDDFDAWMGDLRSRSSNLFKFLGAHKPMAASRVLQTRVRALLATHGSGQPLNHLDPYNQQLTQKSDAVMKFEALQQALDNTLSGIPSWALASDTSKISNRPDRLEIASATRSSLSELARDLVSWNPTYLWLKFRRASLLDPMKYIWQYDGSTLLQGIDSLLRYLGLHDEWQAAAGIGGVGDTSTLSGEMVGLKKKSGVTLVAVSKKIPQHLVPWLSQLSEATRSLLLSDGLIPQNQMHLYEFLSCVAAAVEDPLARSQFISDVLSNAMETIESVDFQQFVHSAHALLTTLGVANAQPSTVIDPANVKAVTARYNQFFTAFNRLLSVGRRCNEASKLRGGSDAATRSPIMNNGSFESSSSSSSLIPQLNFTDEGPVSIRELAVSDPFVPLWPRILPPLLQLYESILTVWHPEHQAVLLANPLQRYVYAISDDEAFLTKNQDGKTGGVFGEGGTAGSVIAGTDRRHVNLLPKWSGWFNELRNTCFQLLALFSAQSVMFSPEVVSMYPRLVSIITDPLNLRSMEHRHFTQFLKHVVELLLVSCPSTMYATHLAPILGPIVEHTRYRLEKTWFPLLNSSSPDSLNNSSLTSHKALKSQDTVNAAALAAQGGDAWFSWYYGHAGLFVGDVDDVIAEAAVDKYRVEIGRAYSDVLQIVLALKGEWALVLANQAKEEQAIKKNDPSVLVSGPSGRIIDEGVEVNADGTAKVEGQALMDARKMLRISRLCHFVLLENEQIAFNLTLTVIQCLGYPDAYTCRRITKICHRILETVAWSPLYSQLLGQQMFTQAVKNIVTEPKWMVGMEWDMINVVRDIYCRLVLGQTLQAGGQGAGQQQPLLNADTYEQAKTADKPLQGGGVLTRASNYPRQILASLPGVDAVVIENMEREMKLKCSAKEQKDCIRDVLREASDRLKEMFPSSAASGSTSAAAGSLFDRAVEEESLLHHHRRSAAIPDLPEKLVTTSQAAKAWKKTHQETNLEGLSAFQL